MKLEQLTAKPKLIEITIDDANIVEKYGEALSFYIYDRQNIETFAKMASIKPEDFNSAATVVKDLILNEKGERICEGDSVLPTDVMIRAVAKVIEEMGKLVNLNSGKTTES